MAKHKGTIGILTGGGDVPGLNPAIRAVTIRALREGYNVIGIRRGWAGLVDMIPDKEADNSSYFSALTEELVDRVAPTGPVFFRAPFTRGMLRLWRTRPVQPQQSRLRGGQLAGRRGHPVVEPGARALDPVL